MNTRLRRALSAAVLLVTSLVVVAISAAPTAAAPFTYASVSTGYHRTCAVTSDGLGLCWGWNHSGSLGTIDRSSTVLTPSIVPLPGGELFSHIEAGSYFTSCGLTRSGNVYCWGEGSAPNRFALPAGTVVTQLSVGATQVCALTNDQRLYCHGDWNSGELGAGDGEYTHVPVRIALPDQSTPAHVSAGVGFTCVITTVGSAYCTGINAAGQLGNGTNANSKVFVRVATPTGISLSAISAGLERACAVDTAGGGWCWGQNYNGAFGDGTYAHSRTPRPVALDPGISLTDVKTGWYHTCAITTAGATLCWGSNDQGSLGWGQSYGGKTIRTAALPDGVTARQLEIGLAGTCITSTDGRIFCWGSNLRGSVGTGNTGAAYSPTQILAVGSPDPSPATASAIGTHSVSLGGSFVPNGATASATLLIAPVTDPNNVRSIPINVPRSRQASLTQLFAPVPFTSAVSGLRPATTYSAIVRASNTFGGNDSSAVVFTTLGDAPAIGTTNVSDIGGDSATVRTTIDANLLDTSVTLTYATHPNLLVGAETVSLGTAQGDSDTELSTTLPSLAPQTTYWARATATNEVGTTMGEVVSFTTVGDAPSILAVTPAPNRRSASVSVALDTGQLRTTVSVSYRPTASRAAWMSQSVMLTATATDATFALDRLDPATTYDVQISARNAAGVANHPQLSFVTGGGAPVVTDDETRDVGETTVTLRTRVDSNEFATRVTLQIDTDESFSNYDEWFAGSLIAGSITDISLDISELVDTTNYFARFVAINAKGTTTGNTVTFTTATPVGKLLKRRVDPVDPEPIVVPTPLDTGESTVIVQPLSKPGNGVNKASTRANDRNVKRPVKTKPAKRTTVKKRSVAR